MLYAKIIITKPRECISLDYDKTVAEAGISWGETKYSKRTLELFRDLLVSSVQNQTIIRILTGNSFGSVYRRGIKPLIELLNTSDQVEYIQNLGMYTSTNVVKTTFDKQGNPIHDQEFGKDIEVDPECAKEIAIRTESIMAGMGNNPLYLQYIKWLKWKNSEFIERYGEDVRHWPNIKVVDTDEAIDERALIVINRYAPSNDPNIRKVIKVTLKGIPANGAYINNYGANIFLKSIYWSLESLGFKKPNKTTFRSVLHYILERKFNGKFQVLEAGAGSIDFNFHGAAGGKMVCIEDIMEEYNLNSEQIVHIGDEAHIKNKDGHWGNDLDPAEKVLTFNTGSAEFNYLLPGYIKDNVIETNHKSSLSTIKASANVLEIIKQKGTIKNLREEF